MSLTSSSEKVVLAGAADASSEDPDSIVTEKPAERPRPRAERRETLDIVSPCLGFHHFHHAASSVARQDRVRRSAWDEGPIRLSCPGSASFRWSCGTQPLSRSLH